MPAGNSTYNSWQSEGICELHCAAPTPLYRDTKVSRILPRIIAAKRWQTLETPKIYE